MDSFKNNKLTSNSKTLRKNMTKEEKHLWYDFLKNLPVTVNRQKVMGKYIVDFFCAKTKTVIEIDGSQHYEDAGKAKDKERDEFFRAHGIKVLRYSNSDINKNFEGVCSDITKELNL